MTSSALVAASKPRWLLYTIIALGFALAVGFAYLTPTGGLNPDEPSHLDYIRLIVWERGLVRFMPDDAAYFETHQPPLYYLLCAPVFALTGGSIFAVRLIAALIQLGTIAVAWRAARDLFPARPEAAWGAASFVALLPTQAQLSGAVNNDSLTTLICTALLWKVGRMVQRQSVTIQGTTWIGALIGLGPLTKLSILQLLPAVAVGYYLAGRRAAAVPPAKKTIGPLTAWVTALFLGCVIASPWLIRNTLLYGDPLTLKIFPLTAGPDPATPAKMIALMGWTSLDLWQTVAARTYETFWHILPPNALKPLAPVYYLTLLLGVVGLLGSLHIVTRKEGNDAGERRVIVFLLVALVSLVPFFVRFNMQFFQAQGRYFLPALLPAALLCVVGWGTVFGRERRGLGVGIVAFLLAALSLFQLSLFEQGQ